jgi:hypothetical protein
MSQKIKIITAQVECGMCPTTITGRTADGLTVYARYRWGHLSVRVDSRDPAPHGGAGGMWILERQIDPEGLDGFMSYEELRELTSEIIEWPGDLTPYTFGDNESTGLDDLLS